jgi:hypothetical protein
VYKTIEQMNLIIASVLHDFRMRNASTLLDEELRYWIKPRSKAWFSIFLCTEYDDARWIQDFRMTKNAVFGLAIVLNPLIVKQDTKFRPAIPMIICVAAALYKLVQGAP